MVQLLYGHLFCFCAKPACIRQKYGKSGDLAGTFVIGSGQKLFGSFPDNFIEVIRFDTVANEVEGRFQVFMAKCGGPSTLPGVPDSVFLTEGKFYLKLQ